MKFIVDAQLPKTLAQSLRDKGFDVVHTSELPDGNDTTDDEIKFYLSRRSFFSSLNDSMNGML